MSEPEGPTRDEYAKVMTLLLVAGLLAGLLVGFFAGLLASA